MPKLRAMAAITVSKAIHGVLRIIGRGGTTFPGMVALAICPDILKYLSDNVKVIAVTGTNGKTTVSRIIERTLEISGYSFLANHSGANLITGITTEFILNSGISARCRKDFAVIECDEAASKKVFAQIQPKVVVVTNVFRDQLDRYGEVLTVLDSIRTGILSSPDAVVCLNADCPLTSSLSQTLPNKTVFYGFGTGTSEQPGSNLLSEGTRCLLCGAELEYDYATYGHLGKWRCPKCENKRSETDVTVLEVLSRTKDSSETVMSISGEKMNVQVNLPADYNIYNAMAAISCANALGIPAATAAEAAASFKHGFGRMERFNFESESKMILVKNPVGFNQALSYVASSREDFCLVLVLNDNDADGTDISWIWDVSFELLCQNEHLKSVVVSGKRAADMSLRLKYAGVPSRIIHLQTDEKELVDELRFCKYPSFILPTYTAMLSLRSRLLRFSGGSEFWEG